MTVNFSLLALDQIVNNAATLLHMSGGQFNIPLSKEGQGGFHSKCHSVRMSCGLFRNKDLSF